jgi:hypothetical protein
VDGTIDRLTRRPREQLFSTGFIPVESTICRLDSRAEPSDNQAT